MTDLSLEPAPGTVLFANADWRLLPDGLEHRGTGYFIERAVLAGRRGDGLWSWPMQLAEKGWCTPRLFREAFHAALERFGIERDEGLARSFAIGFGLRPGTVKREGFVALGDLVRPRPASRRQPEARAPGHGRNAPRGETSRRLTVGANA